MKLTAILTCTFALLMTACAAKVTTYDAQGRVIGACTAERGFIIGAHAGCTGTANQEGVRR